MISAETKNEPIKKISKIKFEIEGFEIIYDSLTKSGKKTIEINGELVHEGPISLTRETSTNFTFSDNEFEIIERKELIKGNFSFELLKNNNLKQKFVLTPVKVKGPLLKRLFEYCFLIIVVGLITLSLIPWWVVIFPLIYGLMNALQTKDHWVCEMIDV
jgi:hypothetical protein